MTNITLSINDKTYKKMKEYSEIKWSEFVRKKIEERISELQKIDLDKKESLLCMIASQEKLAKDWNNKADERWNDV